MIRLDERGFPAEITGAIQEGLESTYLEMGFLDIPHPPGMDYQWIDGEWIEASRLTLEDIRLSKSWEIDSACKSAILSGFESSALGASYHYPAKSTDQQNLASSVLASLLPGIPVDWVTPFWCALDGAWAFRPHTVAQIQQVGQDAKAAILAAMARNEVLQAEILLSTTMEELDMIVW